LRWIASDVFPEFQVEIVECKNFSANIVAEIVNQTLYQNFWYYLVALALLVIGLWVSSFFGAYWKTRGTQFATTCGPGR
jgi:hypothetical protein